MFTIRKATTADCGLIHDMASIVFPATYKEIISAEQMEFMMDWMYSHDNIRKQMEEEGHVYFIAGKSSVRCPLKPKRFYPLKIFNNAPSKSLDRWGYYYFSLFPSVCRHLPDTFSG